MMDATPLGRLARYVRLRDLQAHWGVADRIHAIDLGTVQAPLLSSDLRVLLAEHSAQAAEITLLKQLMAKACLQWSLDPQDQWLREAQPAEFGVDDEELAQAQQESDILLDDGTWLVVIPHTPFAAQIYGRGTQWRTAYGDPRGRNPNGRCQFDENTRGGHLVVVINRANPGERYQYYWSMDLFVDGEDRRVEPDDIVGLGRANPALVRVLIPHVTELAAAFGNPDEQLAAVRRNCHAIRHIADPTEDMKMAAIERSGRALEHIADPTEAMQLAAVHQEGFFITFIKDPTEAVQLVAVSKDSMIIGRIANPCEAAIRLARSRGRDRRGMHIRRVQAPSRRT